MSGCSSTWSATPSSTPRPARSSWTWSASTTGSGSVTDQGRGIAPEDVERIFDGFERGSLATEDGGTGLGLTSVRSLVEEQGGSVHLTSVVDGGTTVTVELPAPTRGRATA